MYELFTSLTNNVSVDAKKDFINLDDRIKHIRDFSFKGLKIIHLDQTATVDFKFNEVNIVTPYGYYCIKNILLKSFKPNDIDQVFLNFSWRGVDYSLAYNTGGSSKYQGFPETELNTNFGLSVENIDDILKHFFVLESFNAEPKDVLDYYILPLFPTQTNLIDNAKVLKGLDIIFGKQTDIATTPDLDKYHHMIELKQSQANDVSEKISLLEKELYSKEKQLEQVSIDNITKFNNVKDYKILKEKYWFQEQTHQLCCYFHQSIISF